MVRRLRSKGTGTLYKREGRGSWIASWFDHDGVRRERSTRTTDRAAAERILTKHTADAALRREGVIDPNLDRCAIEGRRPLAEHIKAYVEHCTNAGQAPRHVSQKQTHLDRFVESVRITRLSELTADSLERHLATLRKDGLSARTLNFARQIAVAFSSWCVRTGRAASNPLRVVPKQDELRDRRRVRRPLTDEELSRLLAVAHKRGRDAWYLAAALAGLRKGDLQRLKWADVNFDQGTITIRGGKAKRVDVVPIHAQLMKALRQRHADAKPQPADNVFRTTVTDLTRLKDFFRAGLANRIELTESERKATSSRSKWRFVAEDAEGQVIDLHALRTTLGTQLARAGVAPQVAQKVMRHGDYRTTLRHYTALGLADTVRAVAQLPYVEVRENDESAHDGSDSDSEGAGAHDRCSRTRER